MFCPLRYLFTNKRMIWEVQDLCGGSSEQEDKEGMTELVLRVSMADVDFSTN